MTRYIACSGRLAAGVALLLLVLAGCGSRPPIAMTAMDRPVMHGMHPHQAVYHRSPDGMYDIVLIQEPVDPERSARTAETLEPVDQTPLRQIVHVQVFWRPPRGTESDHPAAANSAITWYFMGVGTAQQRDLLLYEGSGFTAVEPAGNGVSVRIRDAYLRPGTPRGEMTDPLGLVSLNGRFEAVRNEARVRRLLQEIRFATDGTTADPPEPDAGEAGNISQLSNPEPPAME